MNSKNKKILLAGIGLLLVLTLSITYAYFAGGAGPSANTDIDASTAVSEKLLFTEGMPIDVNIDETNFGVGANSLVSSTDSSATLIASTAVGTANETYQVYFQINSNNFVYTQGTDTPEILLNITGPNGDVTTVDGLTSKTVVDASGKTLTGFDVTTFVGLIKIKEDEPIETTDSKVGTTEEWTATITIVNLNANQSLNEAKTFDSIFIVQKEKMYAARQIASAILSDNGGTGTIKLKGEPDLTQAATSNEGMYATLDNYGDTYYFRGAVDNNWVSFAGMYWRVVRVNGDNSVRLIYTGTRAPNESEAVVMQGKDTAIYFDEDIDINYIGYFDSPQKLKNGIDNWFLSTELNTNYQSYLADSSFCNNQEFVNTRFTISDLLHYTGGHFGYMRENDYYDPGGYQVTINSFYAKYPNDIDLVCPYEEDALTVNNLVFGNNLLDYPVATLTVEEVLLAGGNLEFSSDNEFSNTFGSNYGFSSLLNENPDNISNSSYYLYNSAVNLLLSPRETQWNTESSTSSTRFYLNKNGSIYASIEQSVPSEFGFGSEPFEPVIRPVINIKGDSLTTGTGTWDDPYIIG